MKNKGVKAILRAAVVFIVLLALYLAAANKESRQLFKHTDESIAAAVTDKGLDKAEGSAQNYDKAFKLIKCENAKIYYINQFEPALKLVYFYLDNARLRNERLFGSTDKTISIKFDYDEDIFKNRNQAFKDYAGLYSYRNKTIYILIKDCYSNALALNRKSSYLRHILLHEYTHHVFKNFVYANKLDEKKIPLWFEEGVSDYVGFEEDSGYEPTKLAAFEELTTGAAWTEFNNNGYSAYEQSHYAVRKLILLKGDNIIKDILLKTKDKAFREAFSGAVGMSLEQYEKEFMVDSQKGWKSFYSIVPVNTSGQTDRDIRIQCLEQYLQQNPENIEAMLDLALLYENSKLLDKAKGILNLAVEKAPNNPMTWIRLGFLCEEMNDFEGAAMAFEKQVSVAEEPTLAYINLAQAFLPIDIDKSVKAAKKAQEFNRSAYAKKQIQSILNYERKLRQGHHYEAALQLVKSDTVPEVINKAVIKKFLRKYPHIKNSARNELEKRL